MDKEKVLKIILSIIIVLVFLEVVFLINGSTAPEMESAADNLSGSGLPLANLFSFDGVLFLIYMAGLLLFVIAFVLIKLSIKK